MKIRELIAKQSIGTQDEIVRRLRELGLDVTQATISRDIKELLLVKIALNDGSYKYCLPADHKYNPSTRLKRLVTDVLVGVNSANNLVILKTLPGNADAIGVLIDNLDFETILGNICGDDTILLICQTNEAAQEIETMFSEMAMA